MNLKSFLGTFFPIVINKVFSFALPFSMRKQAAVYIDQQKWIPLRHVLSMAVIRDWAEDDTDEFHRFLWSHHLGYAGSYEAKHAFGAQNLVLGRRMLFEDLKTFLEKQNKLQRTPIKVQSVFDVGCSSGYLLRFMETDLFPEATLFEGIDIDKHALEVGRKYLQQHHSKIHLIDSDMSDLNKIFGDRMFDLILCAGVLAYLHEDAAEGVVRSMLLHCSKLLVIKELAHPIVDNSQLVHSEFRVKDKTFIHNIDRMISDSGGEVLFRRWEGSKTFDGQSVYFVFSKRTGNTE